ncbi:MAG: hypothetical protein M9962_01245 [Oligoflexia bacterium]|nr:hypothetical protein [Oligoflexia bacterium]
MRALSAYDLVVVGDQLGGLFLAARVAEMGLRVLVVEDHNAPSVHYELPSGKFLGDVLLEPIIGLEDGSKIDLFMRDLGLYQNLNTLFPLHLPSLQLLSESFRIDFNYQSEELHHELIRQFGMPSSQADLLTKILLGKADFRGSLRELFAVNQFEVKKECLGLVHSSLFGSVSPSDLPYTSYRQVMNCATQSVRYIMGGRGALKEILLSRIRIFGGDIKTKTRVEEIVFEKGKMSGVLLSSYEGYIQSKKVIGAMSAKRFYDLIPEKHKKSKLEEIIRTTNPNYVHFSFTIKVPTSEVPVGAGSHFVVLDENASLEEDNFLQVMIFDSEVYGGLPKDMSAMIVRVLIPYRDEKVKSSWVRRVMLRSIKKLRRFFPHLSETLEVYPNPEELDQDEVFLRTFCRGLDFIPPSFWVYPGTKDLEDNQMHLLDWSNYGLSGLGLCSRDILPFIGLTGEVTVAMKIAESFRRKA